jgi:tetratricopeptide (TPR) repeat protein
MSYVPQTLSAFEPRRRARVRNATSEVRRLDGRLPSIFLQLVSRLFAQAETERANDENTKFVETQPDLFRFHLERGITLYQIGQYHPALAEFRLALRLNWRDAETAAWISQTELAESRAATNRVYRICARTSWS